MQAGQQGLDAFKLLRLAELAREGSVQLDVVGSQVAQGVERVERAAELHQGDLAVQRVQPFGQRLGLLEVADGIGFAQLQHQAVGG
ncbi:hypothetical protein D3C77_625730 [compost metagenome]